MRRLFFKKSSDVISLQCSFLFTSSRHYSEIFIDICKKNKTFDIVLTTPTVLTCSRTATSFRFHFIGCDQTSDPRSRTNLLFFIFHPLSNGSCDSTLFSPSFYNEPLCKQAPLVSSFKPFLEKGIDRKFEFGVALNAFILAWSTLLNEDRLG